MTSMINLKASRKTGTINVGVNPVTNINVAGNPSTPTTVRYPPINEGTIPPAPGSEFVSVAPQAVRLSSDEHTCAVSSFTANIPTSDNPEIARLLRENAVLKLIIDIQHNNPMMVKNYIVADDHTLVQLVALLCNAQEVHIDADDVAHGCVTKNTYRKVHSIYVVVDGQTLNLKYNFSDVMKSLKDLHISTKFVF